MISGPRHGTRSAELIEVIRTVSTRGTGRDGSIFREVVTYWSKNGDLLAEVDHFPDTYSEPGL